MSTKLLKKDGTYDGCTIAGRQAKGKTLHPKQTQKQMEKGLKNTNSGGKKI